jgi:hypothetical protein
MKAFVEIKLPDGNIKTIEKQSDSDDVLRQWLTKMCDNPRPIIGWLDSGTFAVATGIKDNS